jgi:hypothetical protein
MMKRFAMLPLLVALASPVAAAEVRPVFTEQEAQVLLNFIDIAVRTRGLEAAAAGAVLAERVKNAAAEAKKAEAAEAAKAPAPDKK